MGGVVLEWSIEGGTYWRWPASQGERVLPHGEEHVQRPWGGGGAQRVWCGSGVLGLEGDCGQAGLSSCIQGPSGLCTWQICLSQTSPLRVSHTELVQLSSGGLGTLVHEFLIKKTGRERANTSRGALQADRHRAGALRPSLGPIFAHTPWRWGS